MSGRILIGTSGFSYPHWRGVLYPEGLPERLRLERYCEVFPTVELNTTFYRLPGESTVRGWHDRTPKWFRFAVKAGRFITHVRRLRDAGEAVERLFQALVPLGEKLGPVLCQLPPDLTADPALLRGFLASLPEGLRFAFEFRHGSWFSPEVYSLLEKSQAALVLHDFAGIDCPRVLTAGWTYVRLHGPSGRYAGRYGQEGLWTWTETLGKWSSEGVDVLVYFNNDVEGNAVRDALTLAEMAGEGRGKDVLLS